MGTSPPTQLDLFALHVGICGGDTMSLTGERVPSQGYVVSLPGCEQRVRLRDLSREFPAYIARYSAELHRESCFLGGWVDNEGLVCLDVSVNMTELENAKIAGREWSQDAIYDVSRGEVIYL